MVLESPSVLISNVSNDIPLSSLSSDENMQDEGTSSSEQAEDVSNFPPNLPKAQPVAEPYTPPIPFPNRLKNQRQGS